MYEIFFYILKVSEERSRIRSRIRIRIHLSEVRILGSGSTTLVLSFPCYLNGFVEVLE
jgi:hypothetical protein